VGAYPAKPPNFRPQTVTRAQGCGDRQGATRGLAGAELSWVVSARCSGWCRTLWHRRRHRSGV